MDLINHFHTTVEKALTEIDPKWREYPGLIVCGSHTPDGPEEQLRLIKIARESGANFLGICFGHQLAAIEYTRNVLGIGDATSEEWGKGTFVVVENDNGLMVGQHGGETYWNNYHVREDILEKWKKPENFITCQYHPEYQSRKGNPHPLLVKFLDICRPKN